MSDEFDKKAEEMLTTFPDNWSPSCRQVAEAVAARLRADGDAIQLSRENLERTNERAMSLEKQLTQAQAEIEKTWKASRFRAWQLHSRLLECDTMVGQSQAKVDALTMEIADLRAKLAEM